MRAAWLLVVGNLLVCSAFLPLVSPWPLRSELVVVVVVEQVVEQVVVVVVELVVYVAVVGEVNVVFMVVEVDVFAVVVVVHRCKNVRSCKQS